MINRSTLIPEGRLERELRLSLGLFEMLKPYGLDPPSERTGGLMSPLLVEISMICSQEKCYTKKASPLGFNSERAGFAFIF